MPCSETRATAGQDAPHMMRLAQASAIEWCVGFPSPWYSLLHLGCHFLFVQISIDHQVLEVSLATFRYKETHEIRLEIEIEWHPKCK